MQPTREGHRALKPKARDALEGKGPQRPPQRRLDRRLEEVAKAVGGRLLSVTNASDVGVCRQKTVAGHTLGALEGGGGYLPPPPLQCIPAQGLCS